MKLIGFTFFALFTFSCVSVPPGGGGGLLFNDYKAPHYAFSEKKGELSGESSASCYISLVCVGDATVHSAAKSAGIEKISSVEYRYRSAFLFWSQTTVLVYGKGKEEGK